MRLLSGLSVVLRDSESTGEGGCRLRLAVAMARGWRRGAAGSGGPGGTACGYAAGPPDRSGGGTRSARRVAFSWRGDGTATGQLASAQTVRPG